MKKYIQGVAPVAVIFVIIAILIVGIIGYASQRNTNNALIPPATSEAEVNGEITNPPSTIDTSTTTTPGTTTTTTTTPQPPPPPTTVNCPMYSPPAPGWCEDGTIIPPTRDANGCLGHPTCQR